ncbi:DNA-directed RNA polymerase II subunit RPB11 [Ceratobasidium sp. AG-Ba]|nr:DNA-directed RNA polymerase II subunit RPB11 [Ceratobasidium sp. AG-Ba]QRW04857.1 DNA-directed RNA polymerase II subunit RPB11 [Ceratobasidium sp. AG-Ba]
MAEVTGKAQEQDKITLLKGWTKSAATYCIINETHTIGNALRWMLMKKYAIAHSYHAFE